MKVLRLHRPTAGAPALNTLPVRLTVSFNSNAIHLGLSQISGVDGSLGMAAGTVKLCTVVEVIRAAWAERPNDYTKAAVPVTSAQV